VLCWKNALVVRASRTTALVQVLMPVLSVVALWAVDAALNRDQGAQYFNDPILSLSDGALECRVFDSATGPVGLGLSLPDAWCAPLAFAPSTSPKLAAVMTSLAERHGLVYTDSSDDAPTHCASGRCLLAFASSQSLLDWASDHHGRLAVGAAFVNRTSGGAAVVGTSLPPELDVQILVNRTAHTSRWYVAAGLDALGGLYWGDQYDDNVPATSSGLALQAQHAIQQAVLADAKSAAAATSVAFKRCARPRQIQRPRPRYTRPRYTRPRYTRPRYTRPRYTRPRYTRPRYTRPDYTRPRYTRVLRPP
jgi:hypothetical protein